MTKNPAEIAGTRYKNEKLMSRVQKTDGTSRCFAQIENIKRQSLMYFLDSFLNLSLWFLFVEFTPKNECQWLISVSSIC